MKTRFLTILATIVIFSSNALAGDGYAHTAAAITAILSSSEVQSAATPFYVESIRHWGDVDPHKMTYILQLERDDLSEEGFCLVVSVEGDVGTMKVTEVTRWGHGSRLCHN